MNKSSIMTSLFATAIIFMPFNDLPYFKNLFGELGVEGAFYPTLAGVIIWGFTLLTRKEIIIPKRWSFYFLVCFAIWIIISGIVNLPDILYVTTKGRSGYGKYFLQLILIIFMIISSLWFFENLRLNTMKFQWFRKYILISSIIVGCFSMLEMATYMGNETIGTAFMYISALIHDPDTGSLEYFGRIRAVSGEASWLAMYCGFAFPWIISFILTEKKYKTLYIALSLYLFIILVLTFSRAAYVISFLQILVFLIGCIYLGKLRLKAVILILFLPLVISIVTGAMSDAFTKINILDVITSFSSNSGFSLSNMGRLGCQVAGLSMGVDNPVFGVGLGQFGFYLPQYIPDWALASPEVTEWVSTFIGTSWAGVHNIYVRVIAELGIPGIILWMLVWYKSITRIGKRFIIRKDVPSLTLLVSLIGVFMSGFNLDSFRFYGYWLLLAYEWSSD